MYTWQMIIIFALCTILPALLVYVVLSARINSLSVDNTRTSLKVQTSLDRIDEKFKSLDNMKTEATDAIAEAHKATLRVQNLDESLASLINKMASREREKKREEKAQAKAESEVIQEEVPDYNPYEQLDMFQQPQQSAAANIIPSKRKFGQLPG
jgi:regulator of replication initiation timing